MALLLCILDYLIDHKAKILPLYAKQLPGFPITHIGVSTLYARQFLKVPCVSFNMLQQIMVGPCGSSFLRDLRKANRSIFLWTVNEEKAMKWSIRKGVDGVITGKFMLFQFITLLIQSSR